MCIRDRFHIELGEALFVLTLARSTRGTCGYISYHGLWSMRISDDSVFECPDECYGRVEGCWVIPDVYTVLRGCRLYPGSHPGSFL